MQNKFLEAAKKLGYRIPEGMVFGSYAAAGRTTSHMTPLAVKDGQEENSLDEILPSGAPLFSPITVETHPELVAAVKEECAFRGVEEPALYLADRSYYSSARADIYNYALLFRSDFLDLINQHPNKKLIRALVAHEMKHFYQIPVLFPPEALLVELDADCMALESTDAKTSRDLARVVMQYAKMTDSNPRSPWWKDPESLFANSFVERVRNLRRLAAEIPEYAADL